MAGSPDGPRVLIVMGSDSDLPRVEDALTVLRRFGEAPEVRVLSAHRTPDAVTDLARGARQRGVRVILAAAGASAALPGVLAAHTDLPVIGLPLDAGSLGGIDALLSMAQMPSGVPVAAVGIGGARNAALLALRILALEDMALADRLAAFRADQAEAVLAKDREVRAKEAERS